MGEAHYLALEARGLDADLLVARGWHACSGRSDDLWIGMPYFDQGRRVGCKRRTLPPPGVDKDIYQDRGGQQIFWNVDCLRDASLKDQPLCITEGELDAAAAIQAGFPRTVSVPGGAPNEPVAADAEGSRFHYLEHARELLDGVREIILAVDGDRNGQHLAVALADRLGRYRCKGVVYPVGKDLGDVVKRLGSGGVRDVLTTAEWMRPHGLYHISDMPDAHRPQPLNVGIVGMDQHYRMRRGDLLVVSGAPGHGKSSFINNLTCNMAASYKMNTCFASLEQHPTLDHRRALRSYFWRKREVEMSEDEKHRADGWINERFSFLWPSTHDRPTLPWIMERFAAAVVQFGASICVLDPWNEIDYSDRDQNWTLTEYIHHALRLMKQFARDYDVAMIVAAHPAKMFRSKDGKVPMPGLYDIADSAAWANRCDCGIIIHRPDMMLSNETTIAVVKSRFFSQIGHPGAVVGVWDEASTRYTIVDDGAGMRA